MSVEGGVLSQGVVELNIEALPGDIPDAIQVDVSALEINDDGDALDAVAAGRRHVPGRSRRDGPRHDHPAEPGAGRGGDRDRDRAGRRGRGRAPPRRPRSRPPPRTSPEALRLRAGRLARRRARATRAAATPGTPHNVGFEVADALIARWDLPRPRKKFAGELSEGRTGPGGAARRGAQAADLHERGRPLGRPRARGVQARARPGARHPRRDRPAVRGHPRTRSAAAWPATTASSRSSASSAARTSTACGSASGGPDTTDPDIVSAHVLGKWRQPADEVRALVARATRRGRAGRARRRLTPACCLR